MQQDKFSEITRLIKEAGIESFTSHLSYGEIAKKIKYAATGLSGFAESCFNQNSVDELVDAISGTAEQADPSDMETWDIDCYEWREAIQQALMAKAYHYIYDDLIDAEEDLFENE